MGPPFVFRVKSACGSFVRKFGTFGRSVLRSSVRPFRLSADPRKPGPSARLAALANQRT